MSLRKIESLEKVKAYSIRKLTVRTFKTCDLRGLTGLMLNCVQVNCVQAPQPGGVSDFIVKGKRTSRL
jgi:hypothetical protein